MAPAHDGDRGIILVIVLWVVASLALLISTFNMLVRTETAVTRNALQQSRIEAVAGGAIDLAVAQLAPAPTTRGWQPDGSEHDANVGDVRVVLSIMDANGLVDLNKSDADVLFSLLRQFTASTSQAAAIRDFVMLRRRASSPQGAGQPLGGLAFLDVDELAGAPDVTPDLMRQVRPYLTVHGRHGGINPRTAPIEVLSSTPGVGKREAERLIEVRGSDANLLREMSRLPEEANRVLRLGEGPAYRISMVLNGHGFAKGLRSHGVILLAPSARAPFHVLSLSPIVY